MSRRRKLEKFEDILNYEHVYEMTEPGSHLVKKSPTENLSMKGKWASQAFAKEQPLCLELACGRGEYTLGLARLNPHINYLGVDIKGARIHQGATIALNEGLTNVAFLRIRIEQIHLYFDKNEIDEIWITFPDPFYAKPNRRLTAPRFLDTYDELLKSKASVNLKTDDLELYEFSVETAHEHQKFGVVFKSDNISELRKERADLNISTYYEKLHLTNKKTIKYLHLVKND